MAKSPRSKAKRLANDAFSMFIRVRDAIETTASLTAFKCVTCGAYTMVKGGHCGHWIPGRGDAVLFEEHNAHGQCPRCNTYGSGMFVEHEISVVEKYGPEEAQRLKDLKFHAVKHPIHKYHEIKLIYRAKLKEMIEEFESE